MFREFVAVRRVCIGSPPSIASAVGAATAFFALALPVVSHAGLELTSPDGIDLTGIWTIDAERSDDPEEALESLRKQAKGRIKGGISGGFGGMGGAGGGIGGFGSHARGGGEDREAMRDRMQKMFSASERIEILQLPASMELNLSDRAVSCTSIAKSQVSLPNGEIADQTCGWDDDEFVVEFRGPEGFTRTDRYSPGDDQTLLVHTTVKGKRMPELTLESVYVRSESN